MLIFVSQNSPRLQFIAEHIFCSVLNGQVKITTDQTIFMEHPSIAINYSHLTLNKGIHILPSPLLFEEDVHPMEDIEVAEWEELPCFFKNKKGDVPFDIFAASFFLISRYEEYFPQKLDEHRRYRPEESLAFKHNFLEQALVDQWAYKLLELIKKCGYDTSIFKLRNYKIIHTYDIDQPYAYRNKGLVKNFYGGMRDLFSGNISSFFKRLTTILHLRKDPYFKAIQWIEDFHSSRKLPFYLFALHGPYEKMGRSTIYPLRCYYKYLKNLKYAEIGLHPSYSASFKKDKIDKEHKDLERRLSKKVSANRQHYLRMQIPSTYRQLNSLGFKEDFSLAYAKLPGFRASTALPFPFYDLIDNTCTKLIIRSTVVMDACLITHLGLSPEDALKKTHALLDTCKKTGGDFIMIWHNSNLAAYEIKSGKANPWIDVFMKISNP
ncbi:hypothetical protein AwDysgo_11660 [Bacteroidales bacterium]|nr:hypothetical protein AwDysgo_11660 [Bacteroidales bacterium]